MFALHVPSTIILLLLLGVIRSLWTAALLMIGAVGVLIVLAVAWGLKESQCPDGAAAEPADEALVGSASKKNGD
ncbi:MAG TPA: hypothetical protein VMS96_11535 [Terriglobales bacterium]|nr:hypothetical protein [Terriglobales bacterium]